MGQGAPDQVRVTLSYSRAGTSVQVRDDGAGFDTATVGPGPVPTSSRSPGADGSGYGLPVMRERLARLGGTLVVRSARGCGTTLVASVPSSPRPPAATKG